MKGEGKEAMGCWCGRWRTGEWGGREREVGAVGGGWVREELYQESFIPCLHQSLEVNCRVCGYSVRHNGPYTKGREQGRKGVEMERGREEGEEREKERRGEGMEWRREIKKNKRKGKWRIGVLLG